MRQTSNYQLSQWDPEDPILRTNFNSDNAKVDTALAALQAASLVEKVLDVTTTEAANLVEVDVSGIDFTQYRQVDIYVRTKMTARSTVNFFLNQALEQEYYIMKTSSISTGYSSGSNTAVMASWKSDPSLTAVVHLEMGIPWAGNPVQCILYHCAVGPSYVDASVSQRSSTSIKWDTLTKLVLQANLESEVIPAGANITVMGVKR